MMKPKDEITGLALTERAQAWLRQFNSEDRGLARDFLGMLHLVSNTAYQRALSDLVKERTDALEVPAALYAVRELEYKPGQDLFDEMSSPADPRFLDAVGRGSDIGSEGMTAFTLRNLAHADKARLLTHPSLEAMRQRKCRTIVLVDDLLASGRRCRQFLDRIWQNPTIRSWKSFGWIKFEIVAFAATEKAERQLRAHPSKPNVTFSRYCHTLQDIQNAELIKPLKDLFAKYGKFTSRNQYYGFGEVTALTVFEHRCPNNAPSILWAPPDKRSTWQPLFPNRLVESSERSCFPEELVRHDPIQVLLSMGATRMARERHHLIPRPLPENIALVLTLLSKGMRYPARIAYAMGLDVRDTRALLEQCIEYGFITPRYRLSDTGVAEVKALTSGRRTWRWTGLPDIGKDDYYPTALRKPQ